MKSIFKKAMGMFIVFTLLCGVFYTLTVTAIGQVIFPNQANGSIIEVDGKQYGCELLGQYYDDDKHMWGRIMNIDTTTFVDENNKPVMYSAPSNLSVTSKEYKELVKVRKEKIQKAHGSSENVPVDLVTCSGSGLDPHISLNAANYQIQRIAKNNNMDEQEVKDIIEKCTDKPFLGIFGEKTVNVLKVNLMLDGILK